MARIRINAISFAFICISSINDILSELLVFGTVDTLPNGEGIYENGERHTDGYGRHSGNQTNQGAQYGKQDLASNEGSTSLFSQRDTA